MERRKQFQNEKQDQDLYQYEMGIELGADVEPESAEQSFQQQQFQQQPALSKRVIKKSSDF